MVTSSLTITRCPLRPDSLPLFWPDEDWSRRLNCSPPSPVLRPASSSARCSWGASWRNIDSVSGFSTVKCEVTWPLRSTSMRTSMRPRSAGSSRTSKRVAPRCTEAAISIASPLTGTGALVADVTFMGPGAAAGVKEEGWCDIAAAASELASTGADEACVVARVEECSCDDEFAVDGDAAPGDLAASPDTLPASSCPVAGGCGAVLPWPGSVVAVAEGSGVSDVPLDVFDVAEPFV